MLVNAPVMRIGNGRKRRAKKSFTMGMPIPVLSITRRVRPLSGRRFNISSTPSRISGLRVPRESALGIVGDIQTHPYLEDGIPNVMRSTTATAV